jgi:hypothetical protein
MEAAFGSSDRLELTGVFVTARRLKAEELRLVCDPALLPFRSTEELAAHRLDDVLAEQEVVDIGVGNDDPLLPGEAPRPAGVEEALDLLVDRAAGLDLSLLVDPASAAPMGCSPRTASTRRWNERWPRTWPASG